MGSVTTIDINGGTIDGTTQASGTINGPIAAGGTWTAAATWTLPAHTLGGAITGNSQNISGLGTVGCGAITSTGTLSASGASTLSGTVNAQWGYFTTTGCLNLGADIAASTITNATRKYAVVSSPHFTSGTVQPSCVMRIDSSDVNTNELAIGGGAGAFTAFKTTKFYAAADNVTLGGSVIATLSSTGLAVTGTLSATLATTFGTAASTTTGLSVIDTLDASSTTAASLKTAGGVGIAKKLYVGDNIVMASGKALQTVAGYVEGSEMTAPDAPAANGFRIYAEDNGSGKTRLMVKFATGAAQQLAIEP
jgi:hypothetical protein